MVGAEPESNGLLDPLAAPTAEPHATPRVSKRGGKRPGAGRKPKSPVADAAKFDVARHIDPRTPLPEWTPDLVNRFAQAYLDGRTSMRKACQKVGVTYRAATVHRESNKDFAERLTMVDQIYKDVLLEEQQRRALEDPHRPASLIFELKSRHEQYKPAPNQNPNQVKIQIGFVDTTFGAKAAFEVVDAEVKALPPGPDA